MIDLQVAADGMGKLRARHSGGSEGVLSNISFEDNGPMWRGADGELRTLAPATAILMVALDDGGRLEAPQSSFEEATDGG